MSQETAVTAGKAIEIVRFEEYLDRATDEVFSTMMGVSCAPVPGEAGGTGNRSRLSSDWPEP